jgi:hypothetical protein
MSNGPSLASRSAEIGAAQIRAAEARTAQIGALKVAALQKRALQIDAVERCARGDQSGQRAMGEAMQATQIDACQIDGATLAAIGFDPARMRFNRFHDRCRERFHVAPGRRVRKCGREVHAVENSMLEPRADQDRTLKFGAGEITARQVRVFEIGAVQLGLTQIGAGQAAILHYGFGEVGLHSHRTSHLGAFEIGGV